MLRDPFTVWEGGFPYDLLAPVGITPGSSMKEIRDASFVSMAQGPMAPQVRRAWDMLRRPDTRLAVDFFMVHGDYLLDEQKIDTRRGGTDASR